MRVRQFLADDLRRFDEGNAVARVFLDAGRDRENVRIEDDVFRRKTDFIDENFVSARADLNLALDRVGLALLVERHHDDRRAIAAHEPRVMPEGVLAFLHRNRIDDTLALHAFQARLDHRPLRGVDHDRHFGDIGLRRDQVQKRHHRLFGIEQALVHVDVDDLRAIFDLLARDRERFVVLAIGNELTEFRGPSDVGTLAHVHERNFRRQLERLEARKTQPRRQSGMVRGFLLDVDRADRADVVRRRAAAAADNVDETGLLANSSEHAGHEFRALVIEPEFVRQTSVRIGADQRVGDLRDFRDMRAHFLRAERAIETDRERPRMRNRIPERCRRLAGQRAARAIRDRAGNHDRQPLAALLEQFSRREDAALAFSVSKIVSIRMMSAPPSTSAFVCS
jgi:hypothetical protein